MIGINQEMEITTLINASATVECQVCPFVSPGNEEILTGSAAMFDQLIGLELALPWPGDVWLAKHVPQGLLALFQRAKQNGLNLKPLAIVPDLAYSRPGYTRVFHFSRPAAPFAVFNKAEFIVPNREIVSLIETLLEQPAELARFNSYRQKTSHIRELFICTHGSRDACCGKFGHPIYQGLRQQAGTIGSGRLRVWRVSHIGGHRFAPTLIDLPEGRYWGRLDQKIMPALVERHSPVSILQPFYRGWAALNPYEQIVEQEIFSRVGWPWIDYLKTAQTVELAGSNDQVKIQLDFIAPDSSTRGRYEAIVAIESRAIIDLAEINSVYAFF